MHLRSLILGGALAAALSLPTQAATLVNRGFETGDLAGWTATPGLVEVLTAADDAIVTPPLGAHFTPVEGAYFARLTAGVDVGVYTVLSQAFTLDATSKVSGSAAFLAFDYLPYDDDAFVRILSAGTSELLFASSVQAVGDYGHTSWAAFTSGVLAAGDYVIQAGVRDNVDFGGSSQLLLDNIGITAVPDAGPVPEPGAWALMILGFGGMGLALRRRPALPTRAPEHGL